MNTIPYGCYSFVHGACTCMWTTEDLLKKRLMSKCMYLKKNTKTQTIGLKEPKGIDDVVNNESLDGINIYTKLAFLP